VLQKVRDNLQTTINNNFVWKTIMVKYITHNDICYFLTTIMLLTRGKNCAILVKQSTTVKITSKPYQGGRSVIKSITMDYHGLFGSGSGCSNS
jgi:hypothetical protein